MGGVVAVFFAVVVFCLILAVLAYRRQFRLWRLFALIALVGCLIALGRVAVQAARYAAVQSAYGGRRYTREQAESIRGKDVDILPDSEFLESK